jgi:5'-methylthioadenosine phosphorylase|tara:strand:- start:290 stop:982 length:693 start_codon:yes stop_codon:yes gene_type:complete
VICIFGGTAAYHLTAVDFGVAEPLFALETPHGVAAPFLRLRDVLFTSRHGVNELARSAAFVNHRANLWAARAHGASAVLSWNGVGAISARLRVGDQVVPHDLLDFTRGRALPRQALPEMRAPFWDVGRQALLSAALRAREQGVYACGEGPRLETPAEINAFEKMGADVVGMTLVPEVFLAAEFGLPYAALCIVTNLAAGRSTPESGRRFGVEVGREGLTACRRAAALMQS